MHSIWIQPLFPFARMITLKQIPKQYERTIFCKLYVSWKWLETIPKRIHIEYHQLPNLSSLIHNKIAKITWLSSGSLPLPFNTRNNKYSQHQSKQPSTLPYNRSKWASQLLSSILKVNYVSKIDPNNSFARRWLINQNIPNYSFQYQKLTTSPISIQIIKSAHRSINNQKELSEMLLNQ